MGIQYLEGITPGQKIDLSKFEKAPKAPAPETYLPALRLRLESLAGRLNAEHGDFLEANGQLKMVGEEAELDRCLVLSKERLWAADAGKTLETMAIDREKHPANIAEIATTLLFDKALHDDFIIVRASAYDDYENGADQLIVDRQTGAVICGLDDAILGSYDTDDGKKKENKLGEKMDRGGATIRYGATMKDGKLERTDLKHVPIFYFNLSKPELSGLLASLATDKAELSEPEKTAYDKLVDSLLAQAARYGADESLHPELKDNLKSFAPSLDKMRVRTKTD